MICASHQILIKWSHQEERDGWVMSHVWRRCEVGKPDGNTPLVRPRCRWRNIKLNLQCVGWWVGSMDWIYLAQDSDRWPLWMR